MVLWSRNSLGIYVVSGSGPLSSTLASWNLVIYKYLYVFYMWRRAMYVFTFVYMSVVVFVLHEQLTTGAGLFMFP